MTWTVATRGGGGDSIPPGTGGSRPRPAVCPRSRVAWRAAALALLLLSPQAAARQGDRYIWVEGESAFRHGMKRHDWYDAVNRKALSGDDWLCHFAPGEPPVAHYRVQVPAAGKWRLWLRANPVASARLSFRLGRGPWREVDLGRAVQSVNIAADGRPDMRFIAWVDAGEVALRRGTQVVAFRFHSANQNHGGLDCFLLARGPFAPRGALKPGARSGRAEPGFFAWEPPMEPAPGEALIDLRRLNEKEAGIAGRVRAAGEGFLLGDGRPLRFWAVNAGPSIWRLDDAGHGRLARALARRGVNMVRLHGALYGASAEEIDRARLERLHHLVGALKKEGIYSALSFYFPAWFRFEEWHRRRKRWTFMLLFYCPDMQRVYFDWARTILQAENPHTGLSLAADPALAVLEIQNEDSHLFHTFGESAVPPARWEELKELYGTWLVRRYGSLEKAIQAWGGWWEKGDEPRAGKMHLLKAWHLTRDGLRHARGRRRRRPADQAAFLVGNMRAFYGKARDFFRRECGYGGLVSCGNWHTADPATLEALERWCYEAGDVIDHHGYFSPRHQGKAASYSIRVGQEFASASALAMAHPFPLAFVANAGRPHILSEVGWPMPNAYRAEGTFLGAAYGSLSGLDGIFFFAVNSDTWCRDVPKFPLNIPSVLGTFFASAYIFRTGCVREGPVVAAENLRLEELLDLRGSRAYAGPALDKLRATRLPTGVQEKGEGPFDPFAFYVGRVTRTYGGDPARSRFASLERWVDRKAGRVESATGELLWDRTRGVATLDTPRAQGAVGFLGRAGSLGLSRLTLELENDYGAVTAVALDGKPLARSGKILVQSMTIDRPYGWRVSGEKGLGGRIESRGGEPWGVERLRGRVTLRLEGPPVQRVVHCDENGVPRRERVAFRRRGKGVEIKLPPQGVYLVVLR